MSTHTPPLRDQDIIVPLHSENVSIRRKNVVGGSVRVQVHTQTHDATVDETLITERVEVEHVPIGRVVQSMPLVREEGDVTIIPVVEEVVVVERRLILREEIHLRRVRVTEHLRETVTLREQHATIERSEA